MKKPDPNERDAITDGTTEKDIEDWLARSDADWLQNGDPPTIAVAVLRYQADPQIRARLDRLRKYLASPDAKRTYWA